MKSLELRTLRSFVAVVDAGSLSRAAASLYVAQPALTAQIKKLEAELGAQLLERSHAGVTPTPVGLQLYQDARRLRVHARLVGGRATRRATRLAACPRRRARDRAALPPGAATGSRTAIRNQGSTPAPSTAQEYTEIMRAEIGRTEKMMSAARLSPN